jgi:hypothetical protein
MGSSFSNDIKLTVPICDDQFMHWKQEGLSSNRIICFIKDIVMGTKSYKLSEVKSSEKISKTQF